MIFILILLIVGVIGGTVVLFLNRETTENGEGVLTPGTGLPIAERGQEFDDPNGDEDGDGLSNQDEVLWGTDAFNPDTDGDNTSDGEEVAAGRNPTISGPNDRLPEGFRPGQELNPLDVARLEPLAVDEFFSDNLDLSGGRANLTEAFEQEYDADQQSDIALEAFLISQPIITKLPEPTARAINQGRNDIFTLSRYLEVARGHVVMTDNAALERVVEATFENDDPSAALGMIIATRGFQEDLISQAVPPTAVPVQRLLLGYSELLAATLEIVSEADEDRVKALLAVMQLEEMRARYLPLIEQELERLSALQAVNS